MSSRIVRVTPLPDFHIWIEFDGGVTGSVDLSGDLTGPVFAPLRDRNVFDQASVDEFGAVSWPNGADIAPDAIYRPCTAGVVPCRRIPASQYDQRSEAARNEWQERSPSPHGRWPTLSSDICRADLAARDEASSILA